MPTQLQTLGLFPLPAVLLPGAALGLRVFEPRYLDLVRECGRQGSGFGVCLLLPGEGGLDLKSLIDALPQIPFGIEVPLASQYPQLDPGARLADPVRTAGVRRDGGGLGRTRARGGRPAPRR